MTDLSDPRWLGFFTALFTLVNTALIVWNGRRLHRVSKRVNGMYLQTLAEAERRGNRRARAEMRARAVGIEAESSPWGTRSPD